jgi:hypothetical protein
LYPQLYIGIVIHLFINWINNCITVWFWFYIHLLTVSRNSLVRICNLCPLFELIGSSECYEIRIKQWLSFASWYKRKSEMSKKKRITCTTFQNVRYVVTKTQHLQQQVSSVVWQLVKSCLVLHSVLSYFYGPSGSLIATR